MHMHTRVGRTSRRMDVHSRLWHKFRPLARRHVAVGFGAVGIILTATYIVLSALNAPPKSMASAIATYSIWAVPSLDSSKHISLEKLITSLSRKYNTLPFPPHVTVLGSFGSELSLTDESAIAGTQFLSQVVKPYEMEVMDVASGQEYFRCLHLRMVKSKQVMELNWRAKSIFGLADSQTISESSDYLPHLSLVYGDLTDEAKEEAKLGLGATSTKEGGVKDLFGQKMNVSTLLLYRTPRGEKEMKTWELLGAFDLKGK